MKKILLKILLILMTVSTIFTLAACNLNSCDNGGNNGGDNGGDTPVENTLLANKTSFTLIVGDIDAFTVGGYEDEEGVTLQYTIDNPSVATVSQEGQIEAIGEGEATITATYGEQFVTAKVYSSFGDTVPELIINGATVASLSNSDQYNINAHIKFNNKIFGLDRGLKLTYTSTKPAIATVDENGVVSCIAGADDVVEVIVTASWNGFDGNTTKSMQKTVTFNISNNVTFLINDETSTGYTVYTLPTWGGVSYQNEIDFVYTAKFGNEDIPNSEITATLSDNTMATVENNKLKGLSYGTTGSTTVTLSFTRGGKPYEKVIPITIKRPTAKFSEKLPYFSIYYGYYKNPENNFANTKLETTLFGGDALVDAYQDGAMLNVNDGYVLGVKGNYDCVTQTSLVVGSDKGIYEVDVEAYGHVIQTAQDLLVFDIDKANKQVIGYFEVINDIDATDIIFLHGNGKRPNSQKWDWGGGFGYVYTGNDGSTGFSGVFEGNGYVISNLVMAYNRKYNEWGTNRRGIFGCIFSYEGKSPVIRNIAFENADLSQCNLIANSIITQTTLENVFIRTVENNVTSKGDIVYGYGDKRLVLNNVIIEQRGTQSLQGQEDLNGAGAFFGEMNYYTPSENQSLIKNTYLISEHYISSHTTNSPYYDDNGNKLYPIKYVAYGANELSTYLGDAIPENHPSDVRVTKSIKLPIYRYETYDAMASANHDLSSFSKTDFWVTGDGYPVWRRLAPDKVYVSQAGTPKFNDDEVIFNMGNTTEDFGLVNTMGETVAITSVESSSPAIIKVTLSDDCMSATATIRDGYDFEEPRTVTITLNYVYKKVAGNKKISIFIQPEVLTVEEEVEYSVYDGKFYSDTITNMSNVTAAFQVFEDGSISSLSISSAGDIYGAVIDIKDDFSDVNYITIRLATADVVYEFTKVKAYSGIITKGADLKWFELTGIDTVVEGFYKMANNIDAKGVVVEHYTGAENNNNQYREMPANMTGKFQGVFDGMGYSIDNMFAFRNGLFGRIESNETYTTHIRNVGFTNLDTDANNTMAETLAGPLLATFAPYSTDTTKYVTQISNVYVQVKALPHAIAGGPLVLGMFKKGNSGITHKFTDCFFDYSTFMEYNTAYMNWGLLNTGVIYSNDPAYNNPNKSDRFDNVFVASKLPLHIYRGSSPNPDLLAQGITSNVSEPMPNSNFRITYAHNRIGKAGFKGIGWVSNEYANQVGTHAFYSVHSSKYDYTNYYKYDQLFHEVIVAEDINAGCMIFNNVWQYETLEEMKEAVASDSTLLANFDTSATGFWTVVNNELKWKSAI